MIISIRLLQLLKELFVIYKVQHILAVEVSIVVTAAVFVPLLERSAQNPKITTLGEGLWWAMVTVTSTGYGDYYPVTLGGKIMAVVLMLSGITMLSTVIAVIASFYSRSRTLRQTKQIHAGLERVEERTRRIEKKIDFLVKDSMMYREETSLTPAQANKTHATT